MPKLTDSQLVILTAAASRAGGSVLPLPSSLTLNKGAVTLVLESLIRKGFVAKRVASLGDEIWRLDDDGERLTLIITDQGLAALGIDPAQDIHIAVENGSSSSPPLTSISSDQAPPHSTTRSNTLTKRDLLIELLYRPEGANITEIATVTQWQSHSIRGAISGTLKKKLGLAITTEKIDGRGRIYRISHEN